MSTFIGTNPFVGTSECKILVYQQIGPAPPSYRHPSYQATVSGCPGNDAKAYMSVEPTNPSYDQRMMMRVPSAPQNVRARSDRNGAYLHWSQQAADVYTQASGVLIRRADPGEWVRIAQLPPESTSYVDSSQASRTNFYKVCAFNARGEACSPPVEAKRVSVSQETDVGIGPTAARNLGPPLIQGISPATYTKAITQAPEHLRVQMTFEGSAPIRAQYSIDDGLSMAFACPATAGKVRCWADVAQLIVVGNTAMVWIPYSAVHQSKQKIHIQLSNKLGASVIAIRILPAYAEMPSAKVQNAPQKALTAPSPPAAAKGFGR